MSEDGPDFADKHQPKSKFCQPGSKKPFKITQGDLKLIRYMFKRGHTREEVAAELGVSSRSLRRFIAAYPELGESIDKWTQSKTDEVEEAMFKLATGYTEKEQKPMTVGIGKGYSQVEVVEIEKHIPPDVRAGKYWLNNRRADKWKDRQIVEVGAIKKMDDSELEKEAMRLLGLEKSEDQGEDIEVDD